MKDMTSNLCPSCKTPNSAESKFCRKCRTPLPITCANCGHLNMSESKFCSECGAGLATAGAPGRQASQTGPEPAVSIASLAPQDYAAKLDSARKAQTMRGERRVVTMLFCDIVGSTAAAEQLDPEEWGEIVNGAFEYMILPVSRYEGTVARLMGDAILAFFGAPLAHEDDPQRAILAGLEIVDKIRPYRKQVLDEWGVEFDVRVGINTGLVVVGEVGSDLRMEYTALGDAINLAARMEQTAAPGTVQVSDRTYQHVAPLFEFEDLGFTEVKGKSDPVKTYRPLRRKDEPGRLRGITGLETKLVGRTREQEALAGALERLEQGRGGVLCLIGEAGLGKSRLIQELRQLLLDRQPAFTWQATLSLSYESEQPYGLFRRLMRREIEAAPDADAEILRDKIETAVQRLPTRPRAQTQRVFESLFGLTSADGIPPLEGEEFQESLYTVTADWWQRRTEANPVVLVFDDLHWSDPASIALLQHMFGVTKGIPLLVVSALRPVEETPAFKVIQAAERSLPHNYHEIRLLPLTTEESGDLLDALLRSSDLPADIRNRIRTKSEGNPFFVEEIVRSLIDRGIFVRDQDAVRLQTPNGGTDIEIPGNLQALLTARIDRLGQTAKRTLQAASVVGRSFPLRVLESIMETAGDLQPNLDQLRRAEMILETAGPPEVEYSFKHALVQDAAYSTLLLKQRRQYHRQAGEALETMFSGNLEEQAPALGWHFSEASDLDKSLKYFTIAGDAAFRLYANVEAVDHYTRALAAAAKSETTNRAQIHHLYTRRGRALELDSHFKTALSNYEEMGDFAGRSGDKKMELDSIMARIALFGMPSSEHDPRRGQDLENRVLQLANDLDDAAAEARLYWNLMNLYRFTEHLQKATQYGERSFALAKREGLTEQMAFSINDLILCYFLQGLVYQAIAAAREAQALWRMLGNLPMLIDSLSSASYVHVPAGEFDRAMEFSREALELSRQIDNPWGLSFSRVFIGRVLWARGEIGQAIEVMEECIHLGEQANYKTPAIVTQADLAMVYADLAEFETARRLAVQARESANAHLPGFSRYPIGVLMRVHLAEGDLAGAEAIASEIPNLQDPAVFRINDLPLLMAGIERKLESGDAEMARTMALSLVRKVSDLGIHESLGESLFLQAKTHIASDQRSKAVRVLRKASAVVEEQDGQRLNWQILSKLATLEDDPSEAAALKDRAQKIALAIADTTGSEVLRKSFLARADVHVLVESAM